MIKATQDVFDGVFHGPGVGDIAGEGVSLTAVRANLCNQVVERIAVTGERKYRRPALGDRHGRCPTDTAGRAGDDHVPSDQRSIRVVTARPVGIQVLGPVPPQHRRVAAELRHSNSRAAQCVLRPIGDERGGQVDHVEDLAGDPELGGDHVAPHLGSATQFEHRRCHRPGKRPAQRRQTGRGGDPTIDAAQPNGFRRGQVECLAVATIAVQQRDQSVGDVIDRDDVGAPGVGQHDWSQPGQHGQLGQHTEEVIRSVDLVHLAGARIADHHRRPVDPVPQPRCRPHQQFGFELRLVIRRRQLLADVEIVLGVFAVEISGHRDRRDMVQRRVESARQLDDGTGAVHVGRALLGFGRGDVIDRGTVHDMVDIRAQLGDGLVGQPEAWLGQLAHQRFRSFTPLAGQPFEATQRRAAHQDPHLGVRSGVQQTAHHAAPNKPGTAGNDIAHARHRALGAAARQRSVTRSEVSGTSSWRWPRLGRPTAAVDELRDASRRAEASDSRGVGAPVAATRTNGREGWRWTVS